MTTRKHLKARVRSRMEKTGERYAAARAHVVVERPPGATTATPAGPTVAGIRHFSGIHPETTALRILATHAGLRDLAEETVLAVGGGLGAGVFAFHYEKEGFSSLYLAGRHRWEDGRTFVEAAARRLGLEPSVSETGSAKAAEQSLRTALERGPVAAWVDFAELGYRGVPAEHAGGSYHVLVVYAIDGGAAIVGDLAREPIRVPLRDLARARARVAKQRNRLLSVAATSGSEPPNLASAVRDGLRAGAEALATERRRNFSLAAFEDLARRMTATGADSWPRVFPRGRPLWTGLTSLHRFVETYFTGGGLMRPMLARALSRDPALAATGERYAALGAEWTALARAALPDDAPLLAEARTIQERMPDLFVERGPAASADLRAAWARLAELSDEAAAEFPLSDAEARDLVADLAGRLRAVHASEVAALEELRAATAG
jgi:Butirosin biosynthesis protein H, N-terminal/Domain of unknown function (DUF4872)